MPKAQKAPQLTKQDRELARRIAAALRLAEKLREELFNLTYDARQLGLHDEAIGALMQASEKAHRSVSWLRDAHTESLKPI